MSDEIDAEWTHEALRLHQRYERDIVDAHGLCPWAKRARADRATRQRVLLQNDTESLDGSLAFLAELTADPRAEVAFLIFPRLSLGRRVFDDFVARIRIADAARHELGSAPFVFAAFHPDAEADVGDAERLVPFLRRTPDPTIQLLRHSVLERVRGNAPQGTQFVDAASFLMSEALPAQAPVTLREQIARTNLATVVRVGVEEVKRCLDDIKRDRDQAYAALAQRERAQLP